ncbi:hypothetical protein FDP41_007420 [Naegleria fowleri]|uniref:Uncharacterized protein n=1 Tax=Naegleria fowleri TaxID=5763 RepID=A0A6A5C1C2_NAEFO|nr:uncharacterized protein FDP41_007420 [Naegleria fowleri]KAF0984243.1 hypothetical protein FDP41_007420 [Naegleria fowleri]
MQCHQHHTTLILAKSQTKEKPNDFESSIICDTVIPNEEKCQFSHKTKKVKKFKEHKTGTIQERNKLDTCHIHESLPRSTQYLSLEPYQDIPDDIIYDQASLNVVLKLSIPPENHHIRFHVKIDVLCMSEQTVVIDKTSSSTNHTCQQQVVLFEKELDTKTILREQWRSQNYYFLRIPLKLGISTFKEKGKLMLKFTYFSTSINGESNDQMISQIETNAFTTLCSKAASMNKKRNQK